MNSLSFKDIDMLLCSHWRLIDYYCHSCLSADSDLTELKWLELKSEQEPGLNKRIDSVEIASRNLRQPSVRKLSSRFLMDLEYCMRYLVRYWHGYFDLDDSEFSQMWNLEL